MLGCIPGPLGLWGLALLLLGRRGRSRWERVETLAGPLASCCAAAVRGCMPPCLLTRHAASALPWLPQEPELSAAAARYMRLLSPSLPW